MSATGAFTESVRAFCQWAEGDLLPGPAQMPIVRRHLARLYAQALDLPQRDCDWGDEAAEVSYEAGRAMFERMGALPVSYYPEIADPLDVGCNDTMMGDLADDLADMWRDLKHGLNLFDRGQADAALFQWRDSFLTHWGNHAASALLVLQRWEARQPRTGGAA